MALGDEELAAAVLPFFIRAGVIGEAYGDARKMLVKTAPLIRERIKLLSDAVPLLTFLFKDVYIREDAAVLLKTPESLEILEEAGKRLIELKDFNTQEIEAALRAMAEKIGLSPRKALQPVRVAIAGSKVSPPLFESIELLGRGRTLERIAGAIDIARQS
jgi:glutamyl-tRNA synthetase